jgi:phospholipid/cholesterol/gamma-HCH transport system substrate-binding protein
MREGMRRSVREALVGFSVLAAVTSAVGLSMWIRGMSLSRDNWSIRASFDEASGLAERSAVLYRGVQVGSVRRVQVTPGAVIADLEINYPDLRLARPAKAEIGEASLLGAEAQVTLVSTAKSLPANAANPRSAACNRSLMVCHGDSIPGVQGPSLDNVTALLHKLLTQGDQERLIQRFAELTTTVDRTSRDASSFLNESRTLARNLDQSVTQLQPSLRNLNAGTAHLRHLMAALDNPKTIAELQITVANARQLTARWDQVGGDVNKLTADPQFMDGLRSVTVGLGKLFDELYPAQTGAARDRAQREQGAQESAAPTAE